MTNTLDELERSVERLNSAVERLTRAVARASGVRAFVDEGDLSLLLSERAELLAAVERMRGALGPFAALAEEFSVCGDGQPISIKAADGKSDLNVGHLRRAAEAAK